MKGGGEEESNHPTTFRYIYITYPPNSTPTPPPFHPSSSFHGYHTTNALLHLHLHLPLHLFRFTQSFCFLLLLGWYPSLFTLLLLIIILTMHIFCFLFVILNIIYSFFKLKTQPLRRSHVLEIDSLLGVSCRLLKLYKEKYIYFKEELYMFEFWINIVDDGMTNQSWKKLGSLTREHRHQATGESWIPNTNNAKLGNRSLQLTYWPRPWCLIWIWNP